MTWITTSLIAGGLTALILFLFFMSSNGKDKKKPKVVERIRFRNNHITWQVPMSDEYEAIRMLKGNIQQKGNKQITIRIGNSIYKLVKTGKEAF